MHSAKRISRQGFDLTDAFTLTEVIMAMTVFGLVIAGVMAVFIGTIKSMHASSDAIDVNSRSRFVQERLLYDLRAIVEVTAIKDTTNTAAIIKGDTTQGYATFTATVDEYTKGKRTVTYSILPDGKTPAGKQLKTLFRDSDRVLVNLQDGCFTFYTRDANGQLTMITDPSKANTTTAIRFAFLPKDRGPLIPGKDDPSCSAVIQLRYPSYK